MSEATISEEQVLHNELSFEINQELIHLMKRIIEIQRANQQLKEVIEEVRETLINSKEYKMANAMNLNAKQSVLVELLQILDKAKENK